MQTAFNVNQTNQANQAIHDFSGLWIPLVTPFEQGKVDYAALKRLVAHYRASGIAGLVVCGSTGEAAALSDEEQLEVLQTVMAEAPGLPVIVGVSGYHLGKTVARVRALSQLKLAGILLPAPSYIRPSQAGLIEWFTALADASAVPVVLYDIPYRTGSQIALDTLRALAAHPRIQALKDCGGDPAKTRALIADGQLQVLAGEDANIFSTVAAGGRGAIAAAAHVHTARFAEVVQRIQAGDVAGAEALWAPLPPLIEALFAEPNPGPLKALLARQGLLRDELRSPMTRASAALVERLARLDALVA
ncbi:MULTISPECIES: 4-hydroxy-tetrahydrodipicolinate synthase [unclassified Polaromonas]|uniref:4-hydroxy-tetrahydrodipicolinate synthase n=1 Tax=unclassified Polaromonas TaxID=2638319 RepID=UPI000F07D50C|nr:MULTISPECIES: 4-hydroxy-tetrahydrodipicolinate synthase [unclassified Polaromonas]AYQ29967.1 4-hydroxy-tetrahydrodipicolinate synthase [Polaromonas sp. SP1]QGJ18917.1 4-hydroxy-tetrahydrodipicolinate synthase [Polaromonas sp. Pch-P]